MIQTTQNGPSQFPSPNILVNSEDLDFEVDVRGLDKSHGLLKNQGNCQIKKKKRNKIRRPREPLSPPILIHSTLDRNPIAMQA